MSLKSAEKPNEDVKKVTTSTTNRFTCDIKNYGWDQSDKYVQLFVTLPAVQSVSQENVTVTYKDSDVEVLVQDLDNKNHKLVIKNLLGAIVADKSFHKVKTDMIVVYIMKATPGKKWDYLTKTAQKVSAVSKVDVTEGMKDHNPNNALMSIMQKMYETGDASTKQMIAKAYTENMNKSSEINM